MPDILPSCFGDHGSHAPQEVSSPSAQTLVACVYRAKLGGECRLISISWCKSLMGQELSVSIDYPVCQHTCNVDMKPWLFWKRQGCKSLDLKEKKVEIFWDLSCAKYFGGPEPREGFFVAIVCDQEVVLMLGDMRKEALKRLPAESMAVEATLLSRKEHVFGKQLYTTRAQFLEGGRNHDIAIECRTANEKDPRLSVSIDKQVVVHVKRLKWKFRGNQTILVDGLPIQILWDVHDWFFKLSDGHAVFMFQTCTAHEKSCLVREIQSCSAIVQDHASHSFKNLEDDYSFSEDSYPSGMHSAGFSLLLYAWKHE